MDSASSAPGATQYISGPGELLHAVPYLLGFHPARSLVLVGLQLNRLVVTARLDLTDTQIPGVLPHAVGALARGGSSAVVAAIYDDDCAEPPSAEPPWLELVDRLSSECTVVDCELYDALLVRQRRWWSLMCSDPACCPPDGQDLPAEPTPFAAAATVDGMVALPDRDAVAAILDPLPEPEQSAAAAAVAQAHDGTRAATATEQARRRWRRAVTRALFAAARRADEPGWRSTGAEEAARFGVALTDIAVRDSVWKAIDDRRLDGRALWLELARRLPAPEHVAPQFLFGWASWRAGNCTLAGIAADRALASDPSYRAAQLLRAAVTSAVDPRRLPRLAGSRSA